MFVCFVCVVLCDVVWQMIDCFMIDVCALFVVCCVMLYGLVCLCRCWLRLRALCESYRVKLCAVLRVLFVCGSWD